ncbi:MAG: glycerophosphodiester phosphodiesterase family protein [Maribacter sp.]
MKTANRVLLIMWPVGLLYFFIHLSFIQTVVAQTNERSLNLDILEAQQIVLTSNGFNAKERSTFRIAEQTETIERGLTIIHFNTTGKFEYRTFDTYASEEASEIMVEILWRMQKNKAIFAILAHDSAANGLLKQADKLAKMGFSQLSTLKGRQAYVMHNFNERIFENIDDNSVSISLDIPQGASDNNLYFPKVRYEFKPSINRYIAHAGGEVNGIKSTNTKDALDQNYKKGFRLFELDINKTSDGKLVAVHDWQMWARFTDYQGVLPPSHSEFLKQKIYGEYTTLDFKAINDWFAAHPDATLVTDKVNDPIAFANEFVDKDRLIMELFSLMTVEQATNNGINAMISQDALMGIVGDKLNYLAINNVKYVAISRRIIASQTKLMQQLREQGIKVYVYNVNFDPGKDEKYVQENEIGLIYGMYADKWVFD